MNAFVRQLAVLSVLWSVVELLLPDGRTQPMIRMTMGVLVMTALVTQAGRWMGTVEEMPAWSAQLTQSAQVQYHQTALKSLANQVEGYCVRQAQRAGYQAQAGVWLRQDGAIERIELWLSGDQNVLMDAAELQEHLAQQLQTAPERIHLEAS